MRSAVTDPHGADKPRQHHHVTLAVLTTAALAYALSQTMVIPALPDIQRELHTSTTGVTWVLTAYLLSASIATPIMGRLGDVFGKNRVLVIVLVVFGLGSLVGALAHSLGVLIAGRAIQGIGGATFPLAFGVIRDEFPRDKVAGGIGLISATFGIGGGAGLVISGVLVEHLGFSWIFWLAIPVVVAAVVMTHLFVPSSPRSEGARIDWPGAAMLSAGLIAVLLAISESQAWGLTSVRGLVLLVGGIVVLAAWVRFELRVPEPLVDIRLMRLDTVAKTNVVAVLVGFGMFGSFILIPQFVQASTATGYGFGASVVGAGMFLLPSAAMTLLAGPLSGQLSQRFGSRLPLLLGTASATAAYAFLALAHGSPWTIYVGSGLLGLGIGFAFAAMANLVVDSVPQDQTGVATGINTIMRTIGGAVGGQVAASLVAASVIPSTGLPNESGFTAAFAVSAAGVLVAFVVALRIAGPRRRTAEAQQRTQGSDPATAAEPRVLALRE